MPPLQLVGSELNSTLRLSIQWGPGPLSFILSFNAFHSNKVIYNRMAYNLSCYKPVR
jgi:hypothetical protein